MTGSLVHPDSCPATKTELDLWVLPVTQLAINRKYEVEFRPIAALNGETPLIEFIIPASNDTYLDLDETYLSVKMGIKVFRTVAGVKTEQAITDAIRGLVSPVNNLLHSLFQRVDLEMNGRLVTSTSGHYPYRALLETLLNYDENAMKTNLKGVGWTRDSDFKVSAERAKLYQNDGSIDLFGRLRLDIFNQGRLMLGGIELKLSLQAHKPSFYFIVSDAEYSVEVSFKQVALFLTCAKLMDPILTAQEKQLAKATAKYPVTRTEVKQFVVAQGQANAPWDSVFNGQLPRRMIVAMVSNAAENGSFTTNPFEFKHFNVNYISCIHNGEQFPAIPMQPNFTKKEYLREYHHLFAALEQSQARPTLTITPTEFGSGYTLFAFNFAPDLADGCSSHWNLTKRGNLRLDIRFSEAVASVVTILAFAEFDNLIEIDSDRNVTPDY